MKKWSEMMAKKQEAIERKSAKLEKIEDFLDTKCSAQCEEGNLGILIAT